MLCLFIFNAHTTQNPRRILPFGQVIQRRRAFQIYHPQKYPKINPIQVHILTSQVRMDRFLTSSWRLHFPLSHPEKRDKFPTGMQIKKYQAFLFILFPQITLYEQKPETTWKIKPTIIKWANPPKIIPSIQSTPISISPNLLSLISRIVNTKHLSRQFNLSQDRKLHLFTLRVTRTFS